ncbi:hypothetical protein E4U16_003666, partial [Claviceps sp. LM84 group G4]
MTQVDKLRVKGIIGKEIKVAVIDSGVMPIRGLSAESSELTCVSIAFSDVLALS